MKRIDKVVRPPGLIRSSKTYSLFFDTDHLYGIAVGRAGMKVGTVPVFGLASRMASKAINPSIENAFTKAYAPRIAEGEASIDTTKLPELAKIKYNFDIPYASITKVVVANDPIQGPYIKLNFEKEKLKLIFRDKTLDELKILAKDFGHEVMTK